MSPSMLLHTVVLFQLLASMVVASNWDTPSATTTVDSIMSSTEKDEVDVVGGILAILAIVVGFILCIAGYGLFQLSMFVIGFVAGGSLVMRIAARIFEGDSLVLLGLWAAFIFGGLLFGILAVVLYRTGIFIAGASGGVVLASVLFALTAYRLHPSDPDAVLVLLEIGLALTGGALTVKYEKPAVVMATSLVGANFFVWGIGFFVGTYVTTVDDLDSIEESWETLQTTWWSLFAALLAMFGIGMVFQFQVTGKGDEHHDQGTRGDDARQTIHNSEHNATQYVHLQTPHHNGDPVAHV